MNILAILYVHVIYDYQECHNQNSSKNMSNLRYLGSSKFQDPLLIKLQETFLGCKPPESL